MPRDYPKVPLPKRRPRFIDFRRSDNVEDRTRGPDRSYKKVPFTGHTFNPDDNVGNSPDAGSSLSKQAGYDDIYSSAKKRIAEAED